MAGIGRRLCMVTAFGTEEPQELIVLSASFGQIVSARPTSIDFRRQGTKSIFSADKNWIGAPEDLARMLHGLHVPYDELGQNVSRVETTYRYLYVEIRYGPVGNVSLFTKDGTIPNVKWGRGSMGNFSIELMSYGKYNWDEDSDIKIHA